MEENNQLYLCFVNFIGTDVDGMNTYEFLFTEDKDTFWFENAEYKPLGLVNKNDINIEDYSVSKKLLTDIKFDLIQDSTCFGYQDCVDGCVSIAFAYDDSDFIVKFDYGEDMDSVCAKLNELNLVFN